MINQSHKISVIVPVYNADQYLHHCIDSILAQTYTDFELLLIDDGSTDNSGEMCDEYAKKDNRIKVFHKKNGGVSSSRNLGLDNSKGQYVAFVDSDDYVSLTILETLLNKLSEFNAEISACCAYRFNKERKEKMNFVKKDNIIFSPNILQQRIFQFRQESAVWNKLYKREVIGNTRFQGKTNEEILFNYKCFLKSNRIVYTNKNLYYYRNTPNSITSSFGEFKFDALNNLFEFEKIISPTNSLLKKALKTSIFNRAIYYNILCRKSTLRNNYLYEYSICLDIIRKNIISILFDPYIFPKYKLYALLMLLKK